MPTSSRLFKVGLSALAVLTLLNGTFFGREIYKIARTEPAQSLQIGLNQDFELSLPADLGHKPIMLGVSYSLESQSSNSPSGFDIPLNVKVFDAGGANVYERSAIISSRFGSRRNYSSYTSGDGWIVSATDLQPPFELPGQGPYRMVVHMGPGDSSAYFARTLDILIFDKPISPNILWLVASSAGCSLFGIAFCVALAVYFLSTRRKS